MLARTKERRDDEFMSALMCGGSGWTVRRSEIVRDLGRIRVGHLRAELFTHFRDRLHPVRGIHRWLHRNVSRGVTRQAIRLRDLLARAFLVIVRKIARHRDLDDTARRHSLVGRALMRGRRVRGHVVWWSRCRECDGGNREDCEGEGDLSHATLTSYDSIELRM